MGAIATSAAVPPRFAGQPSGTPAGFAGRAGGGGPRSALDDILVGIKDKPAANVRATREIVMAENAGRIEGAALEKPKKVKAQRMDPLEQPTYLSKKEWAKKVHPQYAGKSPLPESVMQMLRAGYQQYVENTMDMNALSLQFARENRMRFGDAATALSTEQQVFQEQMDLGEGGPITRAHRATEAAGRAPVKPERVSRDMGARLGGDPRFAGLKGLGGLTEALSQSSGPERAKAWVDEFRKWQVGGPGMNRVDAMAMQRVLFGPAALPTLEETEKAFKDGLINDVERAMILAAIVDDPTAIEAIRRAGEGGVQTQPAGRARKGGELKLGVGKR